MSEEKADFLQEEPQKQTRTASKKKGRTIKNLRSGDVNLRGVLFIRAGGEAELTEKQLKDKVLMQRIENGIKAGQLKEV